MILAYPRALSAIIKGICRIAATTRTIMKLIFREKPARRGGNLNRGIEGPVHEYRYIVAHVHVHTCPVYMYMCVHTSRMRVHVHQLVTMIRRHELSPVVPPKLPSVCILTGGTWNARPTGCTLGTIRRTLRPRVRNRLQVHRAQSSNCQRIAIDKLVDGIGPTERNPCEFLFLSPSPSFSFSLFLSLSRCGWSPTSRSRVRGRFAFIFVRLVTARLSVSLSRSVPSYDDSAAIKVSTYGPSQRILSFSAFHGFRSRICESSARARARAMQNATSRVVHS